MTTVATTTTNAGPAPTHTAAGPRVLAKLTLTEGRLYLREPAVVFFGLFFPSVLLLALGLLMPWADEPFDAKDPILSQVTAITGYVPIVLALAIGTVAYTTFPPTMGAYREKGVLRRLSTTPLRNVIDETWPSPVARKLTMNRLEPAGNFDWSG
jgi:ABC-2 type transport system permease protein